MAAGSNGTCFSRSKGPRNDRRFVKTIAVTVLYMLTAGIISGQAPTGTIAGVVRDPSGAVISDAQVQAVNVATGLQRTSAASGQGNYSLPALLAGEYQISAEAAGFQRIIRSVTVEVGGTTTADFDLRVGD